MLLFSVEIRRFFCRPYGTWFLLCWTYPGLTLRLRSGQAGAKLCRRSAAAVGRTGERFDSWRLLAQTCCAHYREPGCPTLRGVRSVGTTDDGIRRLFCRPYGTWFLLWLTYPGLTLRLRSGQAGLNYVAAPRLRAELRVRKISCCRQQGCPRFEPREAWGNPVARGLGGGQNSHVSQTTRDMGHPATRLRI